LPLPLWICSGHMGAKVVRRPKGAKVDGASGPLDQSLAMRGAIEAQVASAIYEMSAVGAILPLLCLVAAFRRWRNTR
jgi:hypothetical protein